MVVIDTALLEELRDVMDDEFVELVNAFESDTRHRFGLLEQAIAVEDSESLRTTAHSMKGGAMGMGAVGLSRRFRGLELRGRECSFRDIDVELENAKRSFDETLDQLRDWMRRH